MGSIIFLLFTFALSTSKLSYSMHISKRRSNTQGAQLSQKDRVTLRVNVIEYFAFSLSHSRYIHTYFICHKLSIVEYKYYVDSNGRLLEKLVLIVLTAHYYIYNKYCSHTGTHTYLILTHNKRMKPRKKKERKDRRRHNVPNFQCAKDCLHIHNHV